MTDALRDLLHDAVADITSSDAADRAWQTGARRRRRHTIARVTLSTATVLAVFGGTALVWNQRTESHHRADSVANQPDAHYQGRPVWFAPSLDKEKSLPRLPDSPLPTVVDLSAPAPDLATHPLSRAAAAYAVVSDRGVKRVVLVGPNGELRSVDISRVKPMTDPEGNKRVDAGPAMLSPSGETLMFPQDFGIELFDIKTHTWRWLYTIPSNSTWGALWDDSENIHVPTGDNYAYSIDPNSPPTDWQIGDTVDTIPPSGSQPYGIYRIGDGPAQSYSAGADVPQPASLGLSPRQSDWLGIAGILFKDRVLVFPAEPGRQKFCCQVDAWVGRDVLLFDSRSSDGVRVLGWQVGTHRFWHVTKIVGVNYGKQSVVSSYADAPTT